MHMQGIKVPKLGSFQDRVFRQYLTKESDKEVKKNQMLAMLLMNSVESSNASTAREWAAMVNKIWDKYTSLEYGLEISEKMEQEEKMMEYYMSSVRNIKAKISKGKDGKLVVTGFKSQLKE